MKRLLNIALLAAVALPVCAAGQESPSGDDNTRLTKQVELKRQFKPVVRKASKKRTAPGVVTRKPGSNAHGDTIAPPQYAYTAVPVEVGTAIPVMEPYGYRTLHNFSDQRGYLDITAGTQLNLGVSAGVRAMQRGDKTLDVWLQHNSTWLGKNTTKLIDNSIKQKQRFNDNLLGANWNSNVAGGKFKAHGMLEFDSFNYYGSFTTNDYLNNDKQSLFNADFGATWSNERESNSRFSLDGLSARLAYGGYGKSLIKGIDGTKEFWLNVGGDVSYSLTSNTAVSLNTTVDVMNRNMHDAANNGHNSTMGMLSFLPQFKYHTDDNRFHFEGGININLSFNDGAFLRLAPVAHAAYKITDGAAVTLDAEGGKTLNHLAAFHAENRYSDPMANYGNNYTPLDIKAGLNLGGFYGFTAKLFVGYELSSKYWDILVPVVRHDKTLADYNELLWVDDPSLRYAATWRTESDYKGFTVGADLTYKYRSLLEARFNYKHCFGSVKVHEDGRYNGGPGDGLDGATNVMTIDFKINPIERLTLEAGFDWRGGRSVMASVNPEVYPVAVSMGYLYDSIELDDVLNLRLRAGYSFSNVLTLWAQVNNLVNKQWDVLPGMGAQKLNIMAGVGFTF